MLGRIRRMHPVAAEKDIFHGYKSHAVSVDWRLAARALAVQHHLAFGFHCTDYHDGGHFFIIELNSINDCRVNLLKNLLTSSVPGATHSPVAELPQPQQHAIEARGAHRQLGGHALVYAAANNFIALFVQLVCQATQFVLHYFLSVTAHSASRSQ